MSEKFAPVPELLVAALVAGAEDALVFYAPETTVTVDRAAIAAGTPVVSLVREFDGETWFYFSEVSTFSFSGWAALTHDGVEVREGESDEDPIAPEAAMDEMSDEIAELVRSIAEEG